MEVMPIAMPVDTSRGNSVCNYPIPADWQTQYACTPAQAFFRKSFTRVAHELTTMLGGITPSRSLEARID
jgi:hypothetical protein